MRGGEAMVCTTGTRRKRFNALPALLVRAFGANTKCQTLAREPKSSHAAARKFAENAGINPPGAPYARTARTARAPSAATTEGAPGSDITIGSMRVKCRA